MNAVRRPPCCRLASAFFVIVGAGFVAAPDLAAQAPADLSVEGAPLPSIGPPADGPADARAAAAGLTATSALTEAGRASLASPSASPVVPRVGKVDKSFEGFGFDDNRTENGFLNIPPDPIGAAGQTRVIAVVNSMIECRTKGGALKWREGLRDFFASLAPAGAPFDPKIVYDEHADRFVVVALVQVTGTAPVSPTNVSTVLLAVSKDANPAGPVDWWFHAIDSKTQIPRPVTVFDHWADYPGFEVDEEAVYVTANMFTFVPFGSFGGVRLWIVDKDGFYDGGAASVDRYNPYALAGIATTTMPTQIHGAGGAGPGIGTFLVSYSGLTDTLNEYVQVVTVGDPLGQGGGPTFAQEFVPVGDIEGPFSALPDAPQLGSTFRIEVNDRRALDAVWRDGKLYVTTTIQPNAGSEVGQTTAHWFELDTGGGPGALVLEDQGDIGGEDIAPGTYTFFPAVALNREGDVAFGFSASAPTTYAGAFVAGRRVGDSAGSTRASLLVKEGEAPYKRFFGGPRNRWGDYSGISVDPTNDKFFWVFNEFADTPGTPTTGSQGPEDGRWGTAWGRFKF